MKIYLIALNDKVIRPYELLSFTDALQDFLVYKNIIGYENVKIIDTMHENTNN